jgi:hypothetical protein
MTFPISNRRRSLRRYAGLALSAGALSDTGDQTDTGHPWSLCASAFAELCYRVAAALRQNAGVLDDGTARPFFDRVGIAAGATVDDAVERL